jgi:hypothetical protein
MSHESRKRKKKDAPVHVTLSLGERNVPVGQLEMHWPFDKTVPFRQPVHFS